MKRDKVHRQSPHHHFFDFGRWAVAGLFTLFCLPGMCHPALSEDAALQRLDHAVFRNKLYGIWTRHECLTYDTENATNEYMDFAIRERHVAPCPGDPLTAPVVDRFRVYRKIDKILWYDVAKDRYLSFRRAKR